MTGSPSIVNLRSSPPLSTSLCASLVLKLPPLRLPDPLSPPNPPEPPDPPDSWPSYFGVFWWYSTPYCNMQALFRSLSGIHSYQQFVVLLFPPCGGFKCNVGTKIFSGVARWLTLSSPRDMGWCLSDASEVPLFDGVRRCYVFLATLVEGIDLKASLVAKEGSVFDAFNSDLSSGASLPGCRCVYASSVEFANSHLSLCFCLNYGCSFSFLICLTMLWVTEFACLAPSSLLYPPSLENS
ncbi:unnamed protein product [Arabidopsis halleri]